MLGRDVKAASEVTNILCHGKMCVCAFQDMSSLFKTTNVVSERAGVTGGCEELQRPWGC